MFKIIINFIYCFSLPKIINASNLRTFSQSLSRSLRETVVLYSNDCFLLLWLRYSRMYLTCQPGSPTSPPIRLPPPTPKYVARFQCPLLHSPGQYYISRIRTNAARMSIYIQRRTYNPYRRV